MKLTDFGCMTRTFASSVAVLAASSWSLACSHDQKPPQTAEKAPITSAPNPPALATQASVEVSERVRVACDLPDSPSSAPQFDYDEAQLRDRGENILDGLARCIKDGNLKGHTVEVVGHADPRGSDAYNYALGERRAQAAASYLIEGGVPSSQVWIKSRGELDASGDSPSEWQLDRNVQIDEKSSDARASN